MKETGAKPKVVQKVNIKTNDENPSLKNQDANISHEYEDIAKPEEETSRNFRLRESNVSNVSDVDYIPDEPPHIPPRRTRGWYFSVIKR